MFDRKSGLLNLLGDGNVNRWLTAYAKNLGEGSEVFVYLPTKENCSNYDDFISKTKTVSGLEFIEFSEIKTSAKVQRSESFADKVIDSLLDMKGSVDKSLIIVESELLAYKLISRKEFKASEFVYWCPVCQTNHKTRSFLSPKSKILNEKIFKSDFFAAYVVASVDQVKYLQELGVRDDRICLFDKHIDRDLDLFAYKPNYAVANMSLSSNGYEPFVYLPFRLTDEGYKFEEIVEVLQDSSVMILSPNMNGASDEELIDLMVKRNPNLTRSSVESVLKRIIKVPNSRDIFYTVIDSCDQCIIPYFEDVDFINHSTWTEITQPNKYGGPKAKVLRNKEELILYLVNR